ncbi:hypothetical protein [Leucobacter aridicollis]|uniref:hypothetical protein n=1 Tax=Leucobacter aridicollis TaxID=283878 RepID=UPI0013C4CFEF|nr:hypothetical protein [Leucobacter aridicollis]UTX52495.1 hypothetical protein KI794_12215 [Leucobacter aridicollis]
MKPAARLAIYGAGLVVAFGAAYGLAGLIVPADFVADWIASGNAHEPDQQAHQN